MIEMSVPFFSHDDIKIAIAIYDDNIRPTLFIRTSKFGVEVGCS